MMKELWEEQYEAESATELAQSKAEWFKTQARESEDRLAQERDWAAKQPGEWVEWVRLQSLLSLSFDFGSSTFYDFPQFSSELGPRPTQQHRVERRDDHIPYEKGNLVWVRRQTPRATFHPVSSPYLTLEEAAAYCRRKPKTLLNHHSLGELRSMPGKRPLLFIREDLDKWLTSRRKSRGN
jgi:hypothetical protein